MSKPKDVLSVEWRTGNAITDLQQWMRNIGAGPEAEILPSKVDSFYTYHLLPRHLVQLGITGKPSEESVMGYDVFLNILSHEIYDHPDSMELSVLANGVISDFTDEFSLPLYPVFVHPHLQFVKLPDPNQSFEEALQAQITEEYIGVLSPQTE